MCDKNAIKHFQEAKKLKRTIIDLDSGQLKLFAKLIASSANNMEFEAKLGLSTNDIEAQKERTGIDDVEKAKEFLKALEPDENEVLKQEAVINLRKDDRIIRHKEKVEKIDTSKPHDVGSMQKKLEEAQKINLKGRDKSAMPFKLENDREIDQFKSDVRYGINFLMSKYSATRSEIIQQLLDLKMDLGEVKK